MQAVRRLHDHAYVGSAFKEERKFLRHLIADGIPRRSAKVNRATCMRFLHEQGGPSC